MAERKKRCFHYSFSSLSILPLFCFTLSICLMSNVVSAQECRQINNCKCKFSNGSIIDLTSLGSQNDIRFKNMTPSIRANYTYYYNPCYAFSLGGACSNVVVCQVSSGSLKQYQNCGNPNSGFSWNSFSNELDLIYTGSDDRTTNVTLKCSREAIIPRLEVIGEVTPTHYEMRLTTRCACPDMCREDHLSTGSVLVILLMIFVSLYLVLGIIHSSLTRGAHGWELIPHYEFWADFPLLVRDGCVFVVNGCKADTSYERI